MFSVWNYGIFLFFCLCVMLSQTEKSSRQYRGIYHALSTVLREEGFRALYKGWLPSVIGVVSNIFLVISAFAKLVTSAIDCKFWKQFCF